MGPFKVHGFKSSTFVRENTGWVVPIVPVSLKDCRGFMMVPNPKDYYEFTSITNIIDNPVITDANSPIVFGAG